MSLRLRLEASRGPGVGLPFPEGVDGSPARQCHHPAEWLSFLSREVLRPIPHFHEHFLEEVVRSGLVVNDSQNQRLHDSAVAVVELRKRSEERRVGKGG